MKKFFAKENFTLSEFNPQARRQSIGVACLLILFFLLSSFTFMNMLYCFTDAVGSIVSGSADVAIYDILRSVPIFLSFFMSLWTLLLVHAYFRNESPERLQKSLLKNSICIIVFGGLTIIYVIVGLITGKYLSIVEGSPSPLFPLDSIIYAVVFICIGVCCLVYRKKYQEKYPYVVPSRGPIVKKARFVYCLFVSFWMLFALFTFSGFAFGLFIIDFRHGYQAYSIALLVSYFVTCLSFVVWELYYNELKPEKRKELLLPLALCGLCVSICANIFYFVALGLNLDGPSNIGFGVLPIAFAASVNIATMLTVLTPTIVSVVALIKGLKLRKQ